MANPLVSICIPSYNHAHFLPEAIESALNQTYRNIEIIITDDGSTDDSLKIAREYASRYPLIQVFTHPDGKNHGISATVNFGFEKSKGQYWSGLPSDDVLYPDKIETQVAFLERNPEIGFVYGPVELIDAQGKKLEQPVFLDISQVPDPISPMIEQNAIPGMSVMARRKCIELVGPHDETLIYSDWEYWVRMLAHWKVGFIDRPLVMWRMHTYNTSAVMKTEVRREHTLAVMESLHKKTDLIGGALAKPKIQALIELHLSRLYFHGGSNLDATHSFIMALKFDHSTVEDLEYMVWWLGRHVRESNFMKWILERLSERVSKTFAKQLIAQLGKPLSIGAIDYAYQCSYHNQYADAKRYLFYAVKLHPQTLKSKNAVRLLAKLALGARGVESVRRMSGLLRGLEQGLNKRCSMLFYQFHFSRKMYWSNRAKDIDERWGNSDGDFQVLRNIFSFVSPNRVLDIGCGGGRLFPLYKTWGIKEVVGQDIAPIALEIARARYPDGNIRLTDSQITALDFPEYYFDIVISNRVLQHIPPKSIEATIEAVCGLAKFVYINELSAIEERTSKAYCFIHNYIHLFEKFGFCVMHEGHVGGEKWWLFRKQ